MNSQIDRPLQISDLDESMTVKRQIPSRCEIAQTPKIMKEKNQMILNESASNISRASETTKRPFVNESINRKPR